MKVRPVTGVNIVVEGEFVFSAKPLDGVEIRDRYLLSITIPELYPSEPPRVTETGKKIPRDGKHHINGNDDTLCLGSPLRLLLKLKNNPALTGFVDGCLVPYLYAISHRRLYGGELPFSELAHGTPGAIADYANLFGLKQPTQATIALLALGTKKQLANKLRCPCGCRRSLGKCQLNERLKPYRDLASRRWFREQLPPLPAHRSRVKAIRRLYSLN